MTPIKSYRRATSARKDLLSVSLLFSTTKKIHIAGDGKDEGPEVIEIPVWNGTVANLTLMALGSSAPEILLSIIEIVGNNFESGELGPGTIVGSAAFNLLAISAVCVVGVPTGETRRIDQVRSASNLVKCLALYLSHGNQQCPTQSSKNFVLDCN